MHPCLPPLNDVGRDQYRKILQPQARRLGLAMPELPRLYHLIRLPDVTANDTYWVLNRDLLNRCGHQQPHELQRFCLVPASIWIVRMGPTFAGR